MWLNLECHSNWNVPQIGRSLKLKCHLNWNVTQIGTSLKSKCHSNWKTSNSTSIGHFFLVRFNIICSRSGPVNAFTLFQFHSEINNLLFLWSYCPYLFRSRNNCYLIFFCQLSYSSRFSTKITIHCYYINLLGDYLWTGKNLYTKRNFHLKLFKLIFSRR